MEPLVEDIERSFAEIERELGDPTLFNDQQRAVEVTREHKRLKVAADLAARWRELRAQLEEAAELASDEEPEIREMAKAQKAEAEATLPDVEEALRLAMVEPDPDDHRDVIVEVRPGAGGDEAAIWVGDLLNMYTRYAQSNGLRVELISTEEGTAGGFKEAVRARDGDLD